MTTSPPRQRHIPELLEIHADELAFMWGQRRAAVHDQRHTLRSFVDLNDRLEAHAQGLLAVPAALPRLLGRRLTATAERDEAFAAAHGLLRLADPAVSARVVEVFGAASGPRLTGIADALGSTTMSGTAPSLATLLATGGPALAVAAATALAHQNLLEAQHPRLSALLLDDDADIATQAWRVVALVDGRLAGRRGPAPPARPYKPALARPEPALRSAVWLAAVWTAQPWLARGLRAGAAQGDGVALGWLAATGSPDAWPLLQAAAAREPVAQVAAGLLGRFGHPQAIGMMVDWMNNPADPARAAAAADAYARATGEPVRGARVTLAPHEPADDFEREFAPSVWLPDLARLREHQAQHADTLAAGLRWNRGLEIGGPSPGREVLRQIDLPARWDTCARAAMAGQPIAAPPPAL